MFIEKHKFKIVGGYIAFSFTVVIINLVIM